MSWYSSDTDQWYSNQESQWEGVSDETCSLLFNFSIGGYTPPSFTSVPFNFFGTYTEVMNLGASLDASPTYQDTTYTYVKSRRLYGLGYCYGGGFQIIKQILYGGIRNLGAIIAVISQFQSANFDLNAILQVAKFFAVSDLRAYLLVCTEGIKDLSSFIRAWHIYDLRGIIGSVFQTDLLANIRSVSPIDLSAKLRIYYSKDLGGFLHGWSLFNLGSFVNICYREDLDLSAILGVFAPYDLKAWVKGWQFKYPFDLGAVLRSYHFYNLKAVLTSSYLRNLKASIYGVRSINLNSFIYGWAKLDLSAIINGGYGPGDLHAFIYGISGFDLNAEINPIKRLSLNLKALVLGIRKFDLGASIVAVGGTLLLKAIIEATGGFNLGASITPRVVKLAKILKVHTMNVVNLTAVVNMAPCFNFELRDLAARLKALYFKDLRSTIYGFRNIAEQFLDLRAIIYSDFYPDKKAFDVLKVVFAPPDVYRAMDTVSVKFWDRKLTFDTITVKFRMKGYMASPFDIKAAIFGEFRHYDLKASIKAIFDADKYLDILEDSFYAPYLVDNIEIWKRLVQLKFYSTVYKYFYDAFSTFVWKDDTNERWVIDVSSFKERVGFFDFSNKFTKLVFSLNKFKSVDEAICYAIDWVLILPTLDLSASLNASGGYVNLLAKINSGKTFIKELNSLRAMLTCFDLCNLSAYLRAVVEWADLKAVIN